MIDQAVTPAAILDAEAALRRDLVRGDTAAASALPVLRHLAATDDTSAFSEEVIASVRGMLADLAAQLLDAMIGQADRRSHAPDEIAVLTRALLGDARVLGHVHAVAIEWQSTRSLLHRAALDPVCPPLVQEQMAAGNALARAFLDAQACWVGYRHRTVLPIADLPLETFEAVLGILRLLVDGEPTLAERVQAVEIELRGRRPIGHDRLQLAQQLAEQVGSSQLLSVESSGVAIFLTALALRSGATRDEMVMATLPDQKARFVLRLLAAGVSPSRLSRQLHLIHQDAQLPAGIEGMDARSALRVLSVGRAS